MSRGLKATAAAEKEPRAGAEDGDAIYQRGIRRKGEGDFVLRRRQGQELQEEGRIITM